MIYRLSDRAYTDLQGSRGLKYQLFASDSTPAKPGERAKNQDEATTKRMSVEWQHPQIEIPSKLSATMWQESSTIGLQILERLNEFSIGDDRLSLRD